MSPTRPRIRRFLHLWAPLFLAGPVIWYSYFWVVYLAAEAGCGLEPLDFRVFGVHWVTLATLVFTAVSAAAIVALAIRARRKWPPPDPAAEEDHRDEYRRVLGFAGAVLGAIFLIATLVMGVPALVLSPC